MNIAEDNKKEIFFDYTINNEIIIEKYDKSEEIEKKEDKELVLIPVLNSCCYFS